MKRFIFITLIILAAIRPLLIAEHTVRAVQNFPGFPNQLEGNSLLELPLSERERFFAADFPGKIGRFSDGNREIILRWINKESRKVHPAADCFRGAGHKVTVQPIYRDHSGKQWNCFEAARQHQHMRVCERIYDEQGLSWSDTSSWFWDATLGKSSGPWWAVTVATPI